MHHRDIQRPPQRGPHAAKRQPSWQAQAAIAGAGIFIASFDLGAISDAMSPVARQWHIATLLVTTLGTATLIGMLAGSLLTGLLADRIGRRRLIVVDVALFIAGSAMSALAPDFALLALGRLATGIAIGADYAVVFPFVAEIAPRASRGRAMAWIMWAANFGVLGAYGIGAALLALSPQGWRILLGGGVLLALPLLALRSRLAESERWRAERLPNLRAIAGELRQRGGRLLSMAAATFAYELGDQGLTLVLPLLLASALSQSAAAGALGATLVKAITIPAALATVLMIERLGRRRLQLVGFFARGVAFCVLGVLLVLLTRTPAALVLALLACGYFFGAGGPDKTTVIVPAESFATGSRGSGAGITQASGRLGGIFGVTLYGTFDALGGPGAGLLLFGVAALLGWLITFTCLRNIDAHLQGPPTSASSEHLASARNLHTPVSM